MLTDHVLLADVADRFAPCGGRSEIREFGNGNINKTYLVSPATAGGKPYLLQRLNTHVFRQPELVMRNMRSVTEHVERRLGREGPVAGTGFGTGAAAAAGRGGENVPALSPGAGADGRVGNRTAETVGVGAEVSVGDSPGAGAVDGRGAVDVSGAGAAAVGERRWEVPHVLLTRDGHDHWRSDDGSFWRALRFIGASHTFDSVAHLDQAREVGFALGSFHAFLSDLPSETLADTLPGFHIAPEYLAHYDQVRTTGATRTSPEEDWCVRFIENHRSWVPVLEQAREDGLLRLRPIHGDPKVNNILFDDGTGRAIGMIDLDTVKPGLVQYDIGDCLRSSCNPMGEETTQWEQVRFDPVVGRAVLEGYLGVARRFFAPADFDFLAEAIRLIAFELGLRFFTDHLEGDVYFKAKHRGHNLARALVQFRLAESIDGQLADLAAVIRDLR